MADYRHDADEHRGEHRSRRGASIFGSGWSGFGSGGARESEPGYRDNSSGSWFGERSGGRGGREGEYSFDRNSGGDRFQRDRGFGYDDRHEGLPIDETSRLIASNKVEGTPVYSRDGERLGTIYNFMVDKLSGKVEYAVMRYGGFLGMGQRYYPLPWRVLTYHTDTGGYVIGLSARDFADAPSFGREDEPQFDRNYGRKVHSWWGLDY
jgi:sporulation protein YlmC with PRC-barrel domain